MATHDQLITIFFIVLCKLSLIVNDNWALLKHSQIYVTTVINVNLCSEICSGRFERAFCLRSLSDVCWAPRRWQRQRCFSYRRVAPIATGSSSLSTAARPTAWDCHRRLRFTPLPQSDQRRAQVEPSTPSTVFMNTHHKNPFL